MCNWGNRSALDKKHTLGSEAKFSKETKGLCVWVLISENLILPYSSPCISVLCGLDLTGLGSDRAHRIVFVHHQQAAVNLTELTWRSGVDIRQARGECSEACGEQNNNHYLFLIFKL